MQGYLYHIKQGVYTIQNSTCKGVYTIQNRVFVQSKTAHAFKTLFRKVENRDEPKLYHHFFGKSPIGYYVQRIPGNQIDRTQRTSVLGSGATKLWRRTMRTTPIASISQARLVTQQLLHSGREAALKLDSRSFPHQGACQHSALQLNSCRKVAFRPLSNPPVLFRGLGARIGRF